MLQTQNNDTVEQRLDDAVTAYLEEVEAGRAPSRQEWLARYPDLAQGLSTFFADTDRVRCWTEPLCQAVHDVSPWKPAVTSFGDYELLGEIGRGGKGVVYEARQVSLNRTVALKMVRIDQLAEDIERRRLRNEAETAARLDHPRVLPIYEVGERDGQLYFSMKMLPGGSLADKLGQFTTQPRLAAKVVAEVARAVHHAHQRGVLHRDLKPSNILLDETGQPHVGDFGLARRLEGDSDLTQSGAILGTPSYMAPEQTVGDRSGMTTAVDVYGLGGILYALLTGRPPFAAGSVFETMVQVREQAPVPPDRGNPRVDRDLATICLKCLQKLPSQRYDSALALAEDLERFLAGQPIVARPVPAWERMWLWSRRQPAAAGLLALAVLAVFVTIAGVVVHNVKLNKAAAEARQGHELADSRYQSARDTLGQMLNQLKAPQIADVPRLQELRLQLLEDALAFYRTALDKGVEADPAIRRDAAFAYTETGATQYLLGKIDSACDCFRRAVELIEGLPTEDRDRKDCQDQLAICHSYLGAHAILVGQFADAERHYLAERSVWAQLSRDEPGNADRQNELARTEHHLGRVFQSTKRWPEAHTHYHRAVEIRTRLVGEHPSNEIFQAQLAETCINLAVVLGSLNRRSEARSVSEKAIGLLRTLVERHPENLEWKMSLAGAYSNVGLGLKNEGKPREALKLLDRAVELIDEAIRQEPRHNVAQERAFNVHGARAQVHDSLKNWPAAVKDWERVIALDNRPNPWLRRLFRALDLARMGDHARAAAEAKTLLKEPTLPDEAVFVLVVPLYALSIEPARKDVRLTADEQSRLAEDYAMQALSLLRKLLAKGYFEDSENAKKLASDPELGSLRGREDFQRLLKQVEARKK